MQSPTSSTKRKIFWSPNSDKSLRRHDIVGYVVHVGEEVTSTNTGNTFFDIKVKTSHTEQMSIRVMSAGTSREDFVKHKQKALCLNKVSKSKDTYFFNKQHGSNLDLLNYNLDFANGLITVNIAEIDDNYGALFSINASIKWLSPSEMTTGGSVYRKCLAQDKSGHQILKVWSDELINKLDDGGSYLITDLKIADYYGFHFMTSSLTSITKSNTPPENMKWPDLDKYKEEAGSTKTKVCCPDIVSVSLGTVHKCVICSMAVQVAKNVKYIKCSGCNQKVKVALCDEVNSGTVVIRSDGNTLKELKITVEVLRSVLGEDKLSGDNDSIENAILELNKIDFLVDHQMNILEVKIHKEEKRKGDEEGES